MMHMRQKPGPTARARAAKRRKEGPVIAKVRAHCVDRDGFCRLMGIGPCSGDSQWAHLSPKKRFQTRGLPPEERHMVEWSFMGCEGHHSAYDHGDLTIVPENATRGAEGYLVVNGTHYV